MVFPQMSNELTKLVQETTVVTAYIYELHGQYEEGLREIQDFFNYLQPHIFPSQENGYSQEHYANLLLRSGALYSLYGHYYSVKGSQETSKNLLTRAFDIFSFENNEDRVSSTLNYLALCSNALGEIDNALAYIESCKQNNSNFVTKNHTITVEAKVLLFRKKYDLMLQNLIKNEDRFKDSSKFCYQTAYYFHLAVALNNLNKSSVLETYSKAKETLKVFPNIVYEISIENNLANVHLRKENYSEAFEHAYKALNLAVKTNNYRLIGNINDSIAQIALEMDATGLARYHSEVAYEEFKNSEAYIYLVESAITKVCTHFSAGEFETGLDLYQKVMNIAFEKTSKEIILQARKRTSRFLRRKTLSKSRCELPKSKEPNNKTILAKVNSSHFTFRNIQRDDYFVIEKNKSPNCEELMAVTCIKTNKIYFGYATITPELIKLKATNKIGRNPYIYELKEYSILGNVVGYIRKNTKKILRF